MADQLTSKVRLVRCPGCRGILPELAPVYQCTGCGTILQAKKLKNDTTDSGSHMHETDGSPKIELDRVSAKHIAQSISQEETCLSTCELILGKNFGSDRGEIRDSSNEGKSGQSKFSSELSTEVTGQINENSSPPVRGETGFDQDECSLEQNNGGDQNESGDYIVKRPEGVSFSDKVASPELNHHDIEELSSPVHGEHSEVDLKQNSGTNENIYGKQLGGATFCDGVASSYELNHHESEESSQLAGVYSEVGDSSNCLEQNNGRNHTGFGDHKREWPGSIQFCDEFSSSTELTCQDIEESSPAVGTSTELDENFKSHSIFKSLGEEHPLNSTITQRPSGGSNLIDGEMPPHNAQLELPQERGLSGFDHVSSDDTLENFALSKSSPLSLPFKDLPKYPTTGSYSAYDGSVSSYDGSDDQVPYQPQHLSEGKFKETEGAKAKAMRIKDEDELQYQAQSCPSISSEQNHYGMKGSQCWEDELVESTICGHSVRSRMKFETDEPFCSRGYHTATENDSPSYCGLNQCPVKEKMELLKLVYELQDQLNRTHILESRAKGRFPGVTGTEKQIPSCYGHLAPEVLHYGVNNTRHPGRCNQERSWTHHRQTSQIPFSSEPTICRHQVDRSCFHGYPLECSCSAPLPPQICCNKSQYTLLPRQEYYNIVPSASSSSPHYTGSEFSSRSRDAKSDDHWHANHHEGKIFSWERHQQVKRHVLPVVGGAPFLVCYICSELLQLPADFLLFGRRCHQLRCSACSVILKFWVQNGCHILPYTEVSPDYVASPPSNNARELASFSHAGYSPNVDAVSCSDDCGPSLCQSCSTEGEPFSTALSSRALNRKTDRKMPSGGSFFAAMEERKRQPVKLCASAKSSLKSSIAEKVSSAFEGLPPKSGSPLHKLLGYASPSQVLDSW